MRLVLWRWHQRIGIAFGSVLFCVVLTGVALSLGRYFGVGEVEVKQPWLLARYGIDTAPPTDGFRVRQGLYAVSWHGQVWVGNAHVANSIGPLLAAIDAGPGAIVLGTSGAVLVTADGTRIDQWRWSSDAPDHVVAGTAAATEGAPCVHRDGRTWVIDQALVHWQERAEDCVTQQLQPLPEAYRTRLANVAGPSMPLDTILRDSHTGQLVGSLGRWLVDLTAIATVLLIGSGMVLWCLSRLAGPRRRRRQS